MGGQRHREVVGHQVGACGRHRGDVRLCGRSFRGPLHGLLEADQPLHDRAILGERGILVDEPGQPVLHARERLVGLHVGAVGRLAEEEGRRQQQVGEHHGELPEEAREPVELLLPVDHAVDVGEHARVALVQLRTLGRLAAEQRDLLAVLADARHAEAEVRLVALLVVLQPDQRLADPMGDQRACQSIDYSEVDEITGNVEAHPEARHRKGARQLP